ncbi:MAG TPA: sortase [Patescibacteria group bacterium]|nr:sortase [Patescibacteria group bacterium]
MDNPLFPADNKPSDNGYVLPPKNDPVTPSGNLDVNQAAELIRQKVARIYGEEPSAKQELAEAEATPHRSKHQQFMHELSNSGKDLAAVQTAWHNYYVNLPDDEKRQVWQEFYESNANVSRHPQGTAVTAPPAEMLAAHKNEVAGKYKTYGRQPAGTAGELRAAIRERVSAGGKLRAKHHLQSLLFGLSLGLVAVLIFLFGFFNEVIIAPFIQPSRHTSATPLIISSDTVAPSSTPEVIIPKINVEIPVNYRETSTDEAVIENDLESGVVHYPTTALPGQIGNTAFFGHSSNNIFNPGKYKFAFVLLHELVPGDTFYLTNNGKVYVYKVFSKNIVEPNNVGVLNPVDGHSATATLITCDPPGTSLHRLIIVGDQVSPDPAGNSQAATTPVANAPTTLPSEGPTLWGRWWGTGYGKAVTILFVIGGVAMLGRRVSRL